MSAFGTLDKRAPLLAFAQKYRRARSSRPWDAPVAAQEQSGDRPLDPPRRLAPGPALQASSNHSGLIDRKARPRRLLLS
jgi:hypothetical protein